LAVEKSGGQSQFADIAQSRIPPTMADMAEMERKRGHYERALEIYKEIAEKYPATVEADLLEPKTPELLYSQSGVLRDKGDHEGAQKLLRRVIKDYPDTKWAERAREVLPQLYLLIAQKKLADNQLKEAQELIRQIIQAYPEHSAAEKARQIDATILQQQILEALGQKHRDKAQELYADLLSRYPSLPVTVEAVRAMLDLKQTPNASPYSKQSADSLLRQAQQFRNKREYSKAVNLLKNIIRDTGADSAAAMQSVNLLPEWLYEAAQYAYGTDSEDHCMALLDQLASEFAGAEWAKKGAAMRQRIEDSPPGMVFIPSGEFLMGTDLEEITEIVRKHNLAALDGGTEEIKMMAQLYGFSSEAPAHTVTTDAFYIDKTEVTNKDYKAFVDETGHLAPSNWTNGAYLEGEGSLPVTNVTLADARAYADWRGARLPTEAEWEKAARGTDGRRYPWGNRYQEDHCNHMQPESAGPKPVASFPLGASPYGCLDMIGNVMEWTVSDFEPYPDNSLGMPSSPEHSKVRRGGCWRQEELAPIPTRCASRYAAHPGEADKYTGFRCVKDMPLSEQPPAGNAP